MPGRFPLLAGPVLRRAEPQAVYIWATTEHEAELEAEIYRVTLRPAESGGRESAQGADSNRPMLESSPIGAGQAETIQIGAHLFVHLVKAVPAQNAPGGRFPSRTLLAYDLLDRSGEGEPKRLRSAAQEESLVYAPMELPSFVLQDSQQRLNALYGSCRKLHGKDADALAAADLLLERYALQPSERPSVLFLMGDQIYADDVASPLIRELSRLGGRLTGRQESIPGIPTPPSELRIDDREQVIHDAAKFTSGECANHLMTFAEYAAMYLFAWNVQNWPEYLDGMPPYNARREDFILRTYTEQRQTLEQAKTYLARVRRLLANVPTYMMFDDHEITDDWFLNQEWKERVRGSAAGRRIVANGLAAFLAFQGWGNNPERFPPELKDLLGNTLGADPPLPAADPAWDDFDRKLWEFQDYAFAAPTRPKAYVINSRTRRAATHPAAPHGAARLLDSEAWNSLRTQLLQAGYSSAEPLILVSPAPIFGVNIIESAQGAAAGLFGAAAVDLESWRANPQNLVDLFENLSRLRPSACIIVSGDVHYAFTAAVRVEIGRLSIPVAQFTSSATKNPTPALLRLLGGEPTTTHWWRNPPEETESLGQAGVISLLRGRTQDFTENAMLASPILNTSNFGWLKVDGSQVENVYLRPDRNGRSFRTWSRTSWRYNSWLV